MVIAKQKNTNHELVEVEPEHVLVETVEGEVWDKGLLYYFSPNRVMEALQKAKWDTEEEIETLVSMIRDIDVAGNHKVTMMKFLRECIKEPLILTGAIRKITMESVAGKDGTRVTKVSEESLGGLALDSRHRMDTLKMLEAGASTPETLEIGDENAEPDGSDACGDDTDGGVGPNRPNRARTGSPGGGSGDEGAGDGPGLHE